MHKPVCIVAGVGPGHGLNISQRFAAAGYRVAMLARNQMALTELVAGVPNAQGFSCDLTNPHSVESVAAQIKEQLGVVETVVYNAGSGVRGRALDISLEDFTAAWQANALGLLAVAQAFVPDMVSAGKGNLLVIGATASLRGGENFAAFASAKAAQRNLTQSLARAYGPQGVHVALVIIDGVIDIPRTRALRVNEPDDFFLQPAAIAESVFQLSRQHSSAWTFELDLRPSGERW